jgi:flagellar basal body P-ring protein FlgI
VGFGVSGKDGSRIAVNVPSAGAIPKGATVEREVPTGFDQTPFVMLNLHVPDFTPRRGWSRASTVAGRRHRAGHRRRVGTA